MVWWWCGGDGGDGDKPASQIAVFQYRKSKVIMKPSYSIVRVYVAGMSRPQSHLSLRSLKDNPRYGIQLLTQSCMSQQMTCIEYVTNRNYSIQGIRSTVVKRIAMLS